MMPTKRLWMPVLLTSLVVFASATEAPRCAAGTFEADNVREIRVIRAKIRAAQFLSKATFGPTEDGIEVLADRINQIGYRRACEEWIEEQFAMPKSSHTQTAIDILTADERVTDTQGVSIQNYRYQAWWHIALTREDQLRQRVAWALSQIFVISDSGANFNNDDTRDIGAGKRSIAQWMGMSNYYDMLCDHVDGNYRDLLGDVTWHPNMGVYLSSWRNRKANIGAGRFPDENYAREIMQLFSVGLYLMEQDGRFKTDDQGALIPTYDIEGIKELARVFTGFKTRHYSSTSFYTTYNFGDPMVMHFQEHDNNTNYAEDPNNPGQPDPSAPASKTIFGVTLSPLASPLTDAGAKAEVEEALDVIANHENVAPFICRLLIQRLVKSNPSRAYMRRVTRKFNDNGHGVRGDMKAVVKAILLDPEVYRGQRLLRKRTPNRVEVVTRGTEYSRLREPIQRVTSLIRAMDSTSDWPNSDPVTGEPYMMLDTSFQGDLGQMPYRAPSVFNYYLPNYQPPDLVGVAPSRRIPFDSLFAPEFQVLDAVTSNRTVNRFKRFTQRRYVDDNIEPNGSAGNIRLYFDLSEELELARDLANLPEILERFDLLLCNGTLSEAAKNSIIANTTLETAGNDGQYVVRLEEALLAVILSPDCAIEE
jgi:uncharacterized protein (DUF1800 family)